MGTMPGAVMPARRPPDSSPPVRVADDPAYRGDGGADRDAVDSPDDAERGGATAARPARATMQQLDRGGWLTLAPSGGAGGKAGATPVASGQQVRVAIV